MTAKTAKFYRRVTMLADRMPQPRRTILLAFVLCTLSTIWAVFFISHHAPLSWQDEYVYLDAVDKAARGVVVRENMRVDPLAMHTISCTGVELYGYQGSACGKPFVLAEFPAQGGFTTAAIHSPLYFFITAAFSKVILHFLPQMTLLFAARLTGALWLGLGLTATWRLMRELGARRLWAATSLMLLAASPELKWSNFYITPDSLSLLAGALILLETVRMLKGGSKLHAYLFVAYSVLFAVIKFQNVFMSGACVVLVAGYAWYQRHEASSIRKILLWTAAGALLGLGAQFAYQMLRAHYALPSPEGIGHLDPVGSFKWTSAINQLDVFLTDLYPGPAASHGEYVNARGPMSPFTAFGNAFVLAGLVAVVFLKQRLEPLVRVTVTSMVMSMLILAPLFYAYVSFSMGIQINLAPRYGSVFMPVFALGLPFALKDVGKLQARHWLLLLSTVGIFFFQIASGKLS